MELSNEQFIECFPLVFPNTHSRGFMKSEMRDLLSPGYYFLEVPRNGWEERLEEYLGTLGTSIVEQRSINEERK